MEQLCDLHLKRLHTLAERAKLIFYGLRIKDDDRQLVVFDIDGTAIDDTDSIDTHPIYYREYPPILRLYNSLKIMGYKIVFVTARLEIHRYLTDCNLEHVGYTGYDDLIMMPIIDRDYTIREIEKWKDEQRRNLEENHGFHLIGCIGDQDADVVGCHIGEYQLRLPVSPKVELAGLLKLLQSS